METQHGSSARSGIGHHERFMWTPEQQATFKERADDQMQRLFDQRVLTFAGKPLEVHSYCSLQLGTSAVYSVQTDRGEYVAKIEREPWRVIAEDKFLHLWGAEGVRTPLTQVLAPFKKNEFPILMLEYIPWPIVASLPVRERVSLGISEEAGRVLARMHMVQGQGFGHPRIGDATVGKVPLFYIFSRWSYLGVQSFVPWWRGEREQYLLSQNILTSDDLKLARQAISLLSSLEGWRAIPSLAHHNFGASNLLYSLKDSEVKVAVIDPNPHLDLPVSDLALACVITAVSGDPDWRQEMESLITGYNFECDEHGRAGFEIDLIHLAIVMQAVHKLYVWHKKGNTSAVRNALQLFNEWKYVAGIDDVRDILVRSCAGD